MIAAFPIVTALLAVLDDDDAPVDLDDAFQRAFAFNNMGIFVDACWSAFEKGTFAVEPKTIYAFQSSICKTVADWACEASSLDDLAVRLPFAVNVIYAFLDKFGNPRLDLRKYLVMAGVRILKGDDYNIHEFTGRSVPTFGGPPTRFMSGKDPDEVPSKLIKEGLVVYSHESLDKILIEKFKVSDPEDVSFWTSSWDVDRILIMHGDDEVSMLINRADLYVIDPHWYTAKPSDDDGES
jgi:hypothetical protein